MKILVLNSGSSSIKYKLLDMRDETLLAEGLVERIGENAGGIAHNRYLAQAPADRTRRQQIIADHAQGMELAVAMLTAADTGSITDPGEIDAIGHRIVHGGEYFRDSTLVDASVVAKIEACIPLAPLHNPGGLAGIRTAMSLFPATRQVAVFDTAFHQTIPAHAYHYALPYELYEKLGIRRYGFHGTSHGFVTREAAALLKKPVDKTHLISLHLGNGASITAVANGKSVDTSMGMTPLAGVIMGSRCGDIDPAIVAMICDHQDLSPGAVMDILSKESGLLGICGQNDLRDIHARCSAGDSRARLALEMLVYRYRQYVGAYLAVLNRVDAIIFTAGIGENDAVIRQRVCQGWEHLGIKLDPARNADWNGTAADISTGDSRIKVLVIPTNEELEIARQTVRVIGRPEGASVL